MFVGEWVEMNGEEQEVQAVINMSGTPVHTAEARSQNGPRPGYRDMHSGPDCAARMQRACGQEKQGHGAKSYHNTMPNVICASRVSLALAPASSGPYFCEI